MVWLEVVGWVGSALLVWSLLQTRILRLRALNLVGCVVLIVYNAVAEVWPMLGLNVVLGVINVWQLRKLLAARHDEAAYAVVELEPDGPLLQHLLDRHARDIERFNPGFSRDRDAARGADTALGVLRGDEVAGIVLVRDAGDGTAQLALDYVTPAYRDFAPGEFVFRQSGIFARKGFRRIVSPPGMVGAYYDRIGFRRLDDGYVLDLPGATQR